MSQVAEAETLRLRDETRRRVAGTTEAGKKSALGQFFTPSPTSRFMAGLFPAVAGQVRLLDAGAGIGALTAAFLDRWQAGQLGCASVAVDAYEIDAQLHAHFEETLRPHRANPALSLRLHGEDFVLAATQMLGGDLFSPDRPSYSHVILNPPYKKISNRSAHRQALSAVGIETVNLYSAFVALAVALTEPGGQIVAIIPRSFCNGPYYRHFRQFLLERAALKQMHLFVARDQAFRDDAVLQENLILHLERGGEQGAVKITTSTDDRFADLACEMHPFERIVFPDDAQQFIHVPTSAAADALEGMREVRHSLDDLGLKVSTGPVVDFRLKAHLRSEPGADTVPLLYPGHFRGGQMSWPIDGFKKANAIVRNAETEKWLYPAGQYCVVRRFSSKEERRRIVASVLAPELLASAPVLGFENHLNVFHAGKKGLDPALALGLATYLNSSAVDAHFRRFNGHTQVNATDLRSLNYPARSALIALGTWAMSQDALDQAGIDAQMQARFA